jgi:hypothetical protein
MLMTPHGSHLTIIPQERRKYPWPGFRPGRGSEMRRGTARLPGYRLVSLLQRKRIRALEVWPIAATQDCEGISSCSTRFQLHFQSFWLSSLRCRPSKFKVSLALGYTDNRSIALWDKGMFGLNYPDQADAVKQNWNNNLPVNPLRESDGFTVNQWFAHGYKGFPPRSGDFMVLPSGGTYNGDVHCNRYGSRTRNPNVTVPLPQYACDVSSDPGDP